MFTPAGRRADQPALDGVRTALADLSRDTEALGPWRSGAFAALARAGMLAGFIPPAHGGTGAAEPALLHALAAVAERCLTTALALTQWAAGCRIIAGGSAASRDAWLPSLARGERFTTVGIAQLSTSRRHLDRPAMVARRVADGWRLDGICPWVTGADSSDTIVTGATGPAGEQMFFVVPTGARGVTIASPLPLMALSGSRTTSVAFADVEPADVIEPASGGGPRTGGLATTALALGAARAATALVAAEASRRSELGPVATGLSREADAVAERLESAAEGGTEPRDLLRADANSLVIRTAQAALTAAKGAGFVVGHPAERLVREAHFFLVWSCPQSVSQAALCELARAAL